MTQSELLLDPSMHDNLRTTECLDGRDDLGVRLADDLEQPGVPLSQRLRLCGCQYPSEIDKENEE